MSESVENKWKQFTLDKYVNMKKLSEEVYCFYAVDFFI
jgi:hypothetical protein